MAESRNLEGRMADWIYQLDRKTIPQDALETLKLATLFVDALEYECMDAITRPRVVILQTFVYDQRKFQLIRLANRKRQRVVVRRPLEHLHPVEYVTCITVRLSVVELNDSFVDAIHSMLRFCHSEHRDYEK